MVSGTNHDSITGGRNNISGYANKAIGADWNIIGGYTQRVTGDENIVGGWNHKVSSNYSLVSGRENTISGNYNFSSGQFNTISANNSSVLAGSSNTIALGHTSSSVISGNSITSSAANTAYGNALVINSGTVGGAAITSDARLKKNIVANSNGLATVMALRPVEYDKKYRLTATNYDRHEIGFIAQEIQKVLPQIVSKTHNIYAEEILAVDYNSLIPVLTKAIQELKAENDALKSNLTKSELKAEATDAKLQLIEKALKASGIDISSATK